ncbi:hypothetical protein L7F22_027485 [Adiantum nelumboides]|nr:hypothetical protein [Adiantum nelumboides]
MVGIATDGDSSMLGCHDGLVAKLRRKVPHLVSTHCIAHREALAILDATKCFPCLSYIDKVANKIYSWIHGSSLRHTGFQNLLNEMNLQVLEVLQIHDVRWLSRGNVMERLVVLMPAILTYWKEGAPAWYKKLRIYKVLFVIHLLADVLHDLNVLNKHFQEDNVDIASISAFIEVTLSSLRRKFLEDDFGKGTKFLKKFMSDTEDCSLRHVNESGVEFVHSLLYETIPGKDKDNEPLDRGSGDVESCKQLAINFVQKVIECINERFPDVYFLNATKLFSPQFYPKDAKRSKSSGEREKKVSAWLSRLLDKVGAQLVDAQGCEAELLAFIDTLYYACEKACDYVSLSSSFDIGVPREYADASNVLKGFVYLFVDMYAFWCLLKVVAPNLNGATGLECGLACDCPLTGFSAFECKDQSSMERKGKEMMSEVDVVEAVETSSP